MCVFVKQILIIIIIIFYFDLLFMEETLMAYSSEEVILDAFYVSKSGVPVEGAVAAETSEDEGKSLEDVEEEWNYMRPNECSEASVG